MKKFRHSLMLLVGTMGMGLDQAAIAADPATATASIDWSQLQLSTSGVNGSTPTVEFFNYTTTLDSASSYPEGNETSSASRNNWTSLVQTDVNAGESRASGLASPDMFSGMADVAGLSSSASSSGNRGVGFSFDGPGVLTVSVPYTISLAGTTANCWICFDNASVSGNASFDNFIDGYNSTSSVSFSLNSFNGVSSETQSGNLVFGIVASGAGTGSLGVGFNLSVSGASMVPEPESYAMILAGLGLMGAVVRRRSRKG